MLDLALATYALPRVGSTKTQAEQIAAIIIIVLIIIAAVSAIVVACQRKKISSSFSGDIVLATFSPIIYWILFACGCVSAK